MTMREWKRLEVCKEEIKRIMTARFEILSMEILKLQNLMLLLYRITSQIIKEEDLNKHPSYCQSKLN